MAKLDPLEIRRAILTQYAAAEKRGEFIPPSVARAKALAKVSKKGKKKGGA